MAILGPPLDETILQLLKNQLESIIFAAIADSDAHSLTEQYLMSRLGLKLTAETQLSPALQQFQQHFVLYHLLFRLQTDWLANRHGYLDIGLAKITIIDISSDSATELAATSDNSSRRAYYNNWQNFYTMTDKLLDDYLQQFWHFYQGKAAATTNLSIGDALQLLQLPSGFSLAELKKAYRYQALLFHPDRAAGNAAKFIQIRDAYQLLLQQLR